MSVKQIVEKTVALIDKSHIPVFGALKDRRNEHAAVANIEKTFKKIKWKAKTPIETGLLKTIEYYKSTLLKIALLLAPYELSEPALILAL